MVHYQLAHYMVALRSFVVVVGNLMVVALDQVLMNLMVLVRRYIVVYLSRVVVPDNYLVPYFQLVNLDSMAETLVLQNYLNYLDRNYCHYFVNLLVHCLSNYFHHHPFPVAVQLTRHGVLNLQQQTIKNYYQLIQVFKCFLFEVLYRKLTYLTWPRNSEF